MKLFGHEFGPHEEGPATPTSVAEAPAEQQPVEAPEGFAIPTSALNPEASEPQSATDAAAEHLAEPGSAYEQDMGSAATEAASMDVASTGAPLAMTPADEELSKAIDDEYNAAKEAGTLDQAPANGPTSVDESIVSGLSMPEAGTPIAMEQPAQPEAPVSEVTPVAEEPTAEEPTGEQQQ